MSTKTKVKIGLLNPTWVPISSEAASARPTYAAAAQEKSLGHAVRAQLSVTTDSLRVYGDDALQISADLFQSAALQMETLLDDLALEAALYGAETSGDAVIDMGDNAAPPGAVYYVQKLMKKDKSIVYRAVILFRCEANLSGYSDNSDTKGETLTPANNSVNFNVFLTNSNEWRWREDFDSEAEAMAGIAGVLHPSASSGTT